MHSTTQISQNCGIPDLLHMHMALRDHGVAAFCGRWRPACRLPAGLGHTVAHGTGHHEDKVNQRHDHKGLHHADIGGGGKVLHQVCRQRRSDHGATAKAHDGHAGGHAAAIREPLDQGGDRGDVAHAQTDAANHPGADDHQPELGR